MFTRPSRRLNITLFAFLTILYVHRFLFTLKHLRDVQNLSKDEAREVLGRAPAQGEIENEVESGSVITVEYEEQVDGDEYMLREARRRGGGGGRKGGSGRGGVKEGVEEKEEKKVVVVVEKEEKKQGEGKGDERSEAKEGKGRREEERNSESGRSEEVERSLEQRRRKVREYCKSQPVKEDLRNTIQNNIFFLWKYKVSTCIIEKVGSMSWRRRIVDLNHVKTNTRDPRRKLLIKKSHEVVLRNIAATSSIVTVRHPLTRLVSCYRDKFENGAHPSLHERHWRDFYMPTLFCTGRIPKDLHLKIGLQEPIEPGKYYPMSVFIAIDKVLQPTFTFTEFLHNVVQSFAENRVNRHWNTYTAMCSPCTVNYTYVTKLETQTQEMDFVFPSVGLPKDMADVRDHSTSTDHDKDEAYTRYYDTVPLALKKRIYEIFKTDFEMFDYEIPEAYWKDNGEA